MFTLLYANSESFAAVLSNTRSRQTVWQYANMRVAKQTLIFTLTQFRIWRIYHTVNKDSLLISGSSFSGVDGF